MAIEVPAVWRFQAATFSAHTREYAGWIACDKILILRTASARALAKGGYT